MRFQEKLIIGFLVLQCFILVLVVLVQNFRLSKKIKSFEDQFDRIFHTRDSFGFPFRHSK